jgi:hypothetical protein
MTFKGLACSLAAAAVCLGAAASHATTVATIIGAYDKDAFDTQELDFFNTSGGMLIGAQMVLHGYQGLNKGVTQTVALPNFGAGQTDIVWGSIPGAPSGTVPKNLTALDYDDEWGNTPPGFTNPGCTGGMTFCSLVGNFDVTFTAKISGGPLDGQPVFAVFSPNKNVSGNFVGFEGLDPTGLSETAFDAHSGTFPGTTAIIQIGTPPAVPEPATWAMLVLGVGALGAAMRVSGRRVGAASAVA